MIGGRYIMSTNRARLLSVVTWVLCALPALAVNVTVPDTTTSYATPVVLPLRLTNVAPDSVVAVEFDIAIDPQIFTLDSVSTSGTGLSSWLADSVRISGASGDTLRWLAATDAPALGDDGVVLWLHGQVADRRSPVTSPVALTHVVINDGTPTTVVSHGSIKILGTDGQLTATPATINLDDTINIQFTDVDADISGSADAVTVRVTGNGDSETLQALETAATSGVFTTAIQVVQGSGAIPEDGQLQGATNLNISVCATDSLDAAGATVERCGTVYVFGGDDGVLTTTVVLQPGDTLHVRLEDTDLIAIDTADVVVNNMRTGESESLRVPQISGGGGVFYTSIPTAFGSTAGTNDDGLLLAQDGDSLQVSYLDDFTATGSTATFVSLTVTIDPLGDASGNGNVRGFDAALILDHSVGAITLSGRDSLAANLDLQAPFGPITAFDASLVLQYRVGLLARFPVQGKDADNHPQPEAGTSPKTLPRFVPVVLESAADGWYVRIDEEVDVWSGQLELRVYEGDIRTGSGLQGAMLRRHDDGRMSHVSFARATPATTREAILFLVGEDRPDVQQVSFNGGSVQGILRPGSHMAVAAPSSFQLYPAVPNPFNPTTLIRYELADPGPTRLVVVNLLGQQVRTLVDAVETAGAHEVVWDGRDDAGRAVAAGTYFHHLTVTGRSATGKMVLAK